MLLNVYKCFNNPSAYSIIHIFISIVYNTNWQYFTMNRPHIHECAHILSNFLNIICRREAGGGLARGDVYRGAVRGGVRCARARGVRDAAV